MSRQNTAQRASLQICSQIFSFPIHSAERDFAKTLLSAVSNKLAGRGSSMKELSLYIGIQVPWKNHRERQGIANSETGILGYSNVLAACHGAGKYWIFWRVNIGKHRTRGRRLRLGGGYSPVVVIVATFTSVACPRTSFTFSTAPCPRSYWGWKDGAGTEIL